MMFIQAIDNRLYRNPVIEGQDWYIRFEDEPEVILKYSPKMTKSSSRAVARKILKQKVSKWRIDADSGVETIYPFPPEWKGLHKGISWSFKIKGPIAIPTKFDCVVDYPIWDSQFMAWKLEFDTKIIYDLIREKKQNLLLCAFLLDLSGANQVTRGDHQALMYRIRRQHPELISTCRDNEFEQCVQLVGNKITLQRKS